MANEILTIQPSFSNIYSIITNNTGAIANLSNQGFEVYTPSDYTHYYLNLTPTSASSIIYVANFPSWIGSGRYFASIWSPVVSGSPAVGDYKIGEYIINWSGVTENYAMFDSSSHILASAAVSITGMPSNWSSLNIDASGNVRLQYSQDYLNSTDYVNIIEGVFGYNVETGWSFAQIVRIILSACAGYANFNSDTNVITYTDVNNTVNRITATTNSSGDRLSLTYINN